MSSPSPNRSPEATPVHHRQSKRRRQDRKDTTATNTDNPNNINGIGSSNDNNSSDSHISNYLMESSKSHSSQLEYRWTFIKSRLYTIFENMQKTQLQQQRSSRSGSDIRIKPKPSDWVEIYTDFAWLYSNKHDSLKRKAYVNVRTFIYEIVGTQLNHLKHLKGVELLRQYLQRWNITYDFILFMKRVLHHLHRYWIWDNANNLKDDPVRPIDKLLMFYWRENLLTHLHSIVDIALNLINQHRKGVNIDKSLIRELVNNLIVLGSADIFIQPEDASNDTNDIGSPNLSAPSTSAPPNSLSNLYNSSQSLHSSSDRTSPHLQSFNQSHLTLNLYHQLFEEPFIASTLNYYKKNGNVNIDPDNFSAFMNFILSQLQNEEKLARELLHEDSIDRVRQAAQDQLIGNQLDYLQAQVSNMIETGQHSDLNAVYSLLKRIDIGLEPVRLFLVRHIRKEGNSIVVNHVSKFRNMNTSSTTSTTTKSDMDMDLINNNLILIEQMVQLYLKHASMVRKCFEGSSLMLMAIDEAFRGFVNRTMGNLSFPILLAHYTDNIMRSKQAAGSLMTAAIASYDNILIQNNKKGSSSNLNKKEGECDSKNSTEKLNNKILNNDKFDSDDDNLDNENYADQNNVSSDEDRERKIRIRNEFEERRRYLQRQQQEQENRNLQLNLSGMGLNLLDDLESIDDHGIDDETAENMYITELVRFFMYLDDKDLFCETHRRLFAQRLLGTKYDENLENQFIIRLEKRMGGIYTRRYRGMMQDVVSSNALFPKFTDYLYEKLKLIVIEEKKKVASDSGSGKAVEDEGCSSGKSKDIVSIDVSRQGKASQSKQNAAEIVVDLTGESDVLEVEPVSINTSNAVGTSRNTRRNRTRVVFPRNNNGPASAPGAAPNPNSNAANNPNGAVYINLEEPQVDNEAIGNNIVEQNAPHANNSNNQPQNNHNVSDDMDGVVVIIPVPMETSDGNAQNANPTVGGHTTGTNGPNSHTTESTAVKIKKEKEEKEKEDKVNEEVVKAELELSQLPKESVKEALALESSARVLNGIHWPTEKSEDVKLPPVLRACHALFTGFYMRNRACRTLTWLDRMSTITLTARFNHKGNENCKSVDIVTSTSQACILLLFNDTDEMSINGMAKKLDISVEEVMRQLKPLVSRRHSGLLKYTVEKEANMSTSSGNGSKNEQEASRKRKRNESTKASEMPNKDENEGKTSSDGGVDVGRRIISLNEKFELENDEEEITVPLSTIESGNEEVEKSRKAVVVDRNTVLDAALVRIMKSKKESTHVNLCADVIKETSSTFMPDPKLIKTRIERLIEMEYIVRSTKDPKIYNYGA